MKFLSVTLNGWRQFANVDIEFDSNITIITGANGAGKSTILRVLSLHFGWNYPILATPTFSKDGTINYLSGLFKWLPKFGKEPPPNPENVVGKIRYSNNVETLLTLPSGVGIQYNLNMPTAQSVLGLHIPSHRPVGSYQQVQNIPTNRPIYH